MINVPYREKSGKYNKPNPKPNKILYPASVTTLFQSDNNMFDFTKFSYILEWAFPEMKIVPPPCLLRIPLFLKLTPLVFQVKFSNFL